MYMHTCERFVLQRKGGRLREARSSLCVLSIQHGNIKKKPYTGRVNDDIPCIFYDWFFTSLSPRM